MNEKHSPELIDDVRKNSSPKDQVDVEHSMLKLLG